MNLTRVWKYHAQLVRPGPIFHSGQVRNFYLLFLGQVYRKLMQFCISYWSNYFKHACCWILISCLLQKPADLDLHCFQLSLYLSSLILFSIKFTFGISTVRAKLSCLYIICHLGQVKFSQDKYIMDFQWFFYLRVLRLRRMILTKDAWF